MSSTSENSEAVKISSGQNMKKTGDETSKNSDIISPINSADLMESSSARSVNADVSGANKIEKTENIIERQTVHVSSGNSTPMECTSEQCETAKPYSDEQIISKEMSKPTVDNEAKSVSQTIKIKGSERSTFQIPSGTDILALACEAVASELAANKSTTFDNAPKETTASDQTFTIYTAKSGAQSTDEDVKQKNSPNKYFVEIVKEYEPNVLAELADPGAPTDIQTKKLPTEMTKETEITGLEKEEGRSTYVICEDTSLNQTPSKDIQGKHKILTRSATKTPISKTEKWQTRDGYSDEVDDETESPPSKKKKNKDSSEPEHSYSLGRSDKKTDTDVALESGIKNISSITSTTSQKNTAETETNEPQGNNVMTGITSKVNPDGLQVSVTSPDELYTVELTTISTIGGVIKPVTITVLNVAGMMFKCGKCTKPFEKQLPARTLNYFKYHNCPKEKVISETPKTLQQKTMPSPSVTHSASQTPVSSASTAKRPVGRPPKHQRGRGRPRKIPLAVEPDEQEKGDLENTKKTDSSEKNKNTLTEISADVQEGKTDREEKDDIDDPEDVDIESLSSRKQQIQFIKEQYMKAKRRSDRLLKNGTKDIKTEADLNTPGDDSDDDFHDDGELDDPSDPDFVKESNAKVAQGEDGGTSEMVNSDKKDFCIKCYLKLEHKCRVKVKVANRFKTKTCNVCNKTYKTVNSLTQHMRVHTGERPYICQICSKAFRRSSTLFEHMQIHNGVKKFLCSVCGRKFLRKSDHTAHMRIHSNDFNFRCEVCGKGFKGNSQLVVHMRKHTGEMPFLCTVCGHKFKHPFGLQVHMKFHEMSENPLRCTECSTEYEDLDELRMHDCPQGKQHMCTVCGKTFANHFAVKGHMKIHLRDNPSVCKSCHETFPNEQDLQIHQDENIVKCSDCFKTIKEARACMLNKLPGNSLKGKKFKCWTCHSAQCAAREQTEGPKTASSTAIEPDPVTELQQQQQTPVTEAEEENVNYTEVHVEHHIQIQHQEVVRSDVSHMHQSQHVEQMIGESAAQDIGQSVQVYHTSEPITLHIDESNQPTQEGQSIISRMLHPTTVEVYTTTQPMPDGTHQIAAATQLGEAIQSIEATANGDHTFYETQTVYSNMIPPVQAQETVHYTTQVQQQHLIPQYHNDPGQQQQHIQTVYQMQPMTQQNSLLNPHQTMHQM